jgi:hypothetical protein
MKTNKFLTFALIGDSLLARSYAKTIIDSGIKSRENFNLKYICPPNKTTTDKTEEKNIDPAPKWYEKYSIKPKTVNEIMHDSEVNAIILDSRLNNHDQIIKLACLYKKAVFCLPSISNKLEYLYQTKCMVEHANIPFYIALNTNVFPHHKTLVDSLEYTQPSIIRISHKITSYENYWQQDNLYDIDFAQSLGNCEIKEVYAKRTPKNLFIQLTLKNMCLCNLELTITNQDQNTHNSNPLIEIYSNDTIYPIKPTTPHISFDPQAQNKHLEEFINLIKNSKQEDQKIKQNISLNKKLELIAIQLATKQSLKENKLIRVRNVLASFQCDKKNLNPVNYLADYNSEETSQ